MKTKLAPAALLAAITAFGLGISPAFASAVASGNSGGYVFPDFWADEPALQAPAVNQPGHYAAGAYSNDSGHSAALFPPNPNQG